MSFDPLAVWDYNKHQFLEKICSMTEEKDAFVFLDTCAKHFLDQGVQWDVVVYLRTMMLSVIQKRFTKVDLAADEHNTLSGIPEPEIPVMFKISDWERAKTRIESYNEQLLRQRVKDRATTGRRPQGLIEYRMLMPEANRNTPFVAERRVVLEAEHPGE